MKRLNIALIGSGNVAVHFGEVLRNKGHQLIQVFSRTESNARFLGEKWAIPYTNQWNALNKEADLYLFALNDNAYFEIPEALNFDARLVVHTSGSVPLKALKNLSSQSGVLYPLQTFSKDRKVDFSQVPLCIEGNNSTTEAFLKTLAEELSDRVEAISSEKRKKLHLAAVFVCNFVNHQYAIGEKLLGDADLSSDLLNPLLAETASKALDLGALAAQTGPAIRNNQSIIADHLKMLEAHPNFQNIYKFVSQSILDFHRND